MNPALQNLRTDLLGSWKTVLKALFLGILVSAVFLGLLSTQLGIKLGGKSPAIEHVVAINVRAPSDDIYSLFYSPAESTVWAEVDQVFKPAGHPFAVQVLRFTLPETDIPRLRIDLGTHAETVRIDKLSLMTRLGNTCSWSGAQMADYFEPAGDVQSAEVEGSALRVEVSGIDGMIVADPFTLERDCDTSGAAGTTGYGRWVWAGLLSSLALGGLYFWLAGRGASFRDLGMVSLILAVLVLPVAGQALGLGNAIVNAENRALNSPPPWPRTIYQLADYTNRWTAYFNDHFGWRNELIFLGNLGKVGLLKTSPVAGVVMGNDGWLYFAGEDAMLDYQGVYTLKRFEREAIDSYLGGIDRRLEADEIEFMVVVAPDKETVYPEYLPPTMRKVRAVTRFDQILNYNSQHSQVPILDLRPALLEHKDGTPLYYKTDTHWNFMGGFYGYQAIITRLGELFPGMFPAAQPHSLEDYELVTYPAPGKDLAKLTMMRWYFTDIELELRPRYPVKQHEAALGYRPASMLPAFARAVDDPKLPTAVVFHDSFARYLFPFLSEHFERVVYVWSYDVDWEVIEKEQPDVVILQLVERQIGQLLK